MIGAIVKAANKLSEGTHMEQGYAVESDGRKMATPNKKKKIGFFKRWMLNSVKQAIEADRANQMGPDALVGSNEIRTARIGISTPSSIDNTERSINFTVHVANGGRVIETRRHDRKTDRSTNGLYVITNDQDFGKEIDKIITMEALR